MTLRTRLAAIAGTALLVVIVIVFLATYVVVARGYDRQYDRELARQATTVLRLVDESAPSRRVRPQRGQRGSGPRGEAGPRPTAGGLPLRVARRELLAQVVARDGTIRSTSEPLGELGQLPFDEQTLSLAADNVRTRDGTVGESQLRIYERALPGGDVLQLAVDRGDGDAALQLLRRILFLATLIATAIAALLGWRLARAALAPIDRMTTTARNIERTGDLSRRVDQPTTADELGMLAATLNEMLDALERGETAVRRFVADASHELRTPITSLSGNLDFLERTDIPELDREAARADVHADVARLEQLASDLLELARRDASAPIERRPVDIGQLVTETCATAGRLHTGHHIECAATAITIDGSAPLLERAVRNLVENACRYTPQGTTVTAECNTRGQDIVIAVRDDGPGLDTADARQVFNRFFRGGTAVGTEGSGLGLAIVDQVARAHGGRAEVESTRGQGSEFRLVLPTGPRGGFVPGSS